MEQYDREERQYDRDEPDRSAPQPSGTLPGDFPWQESAGTDQPAPVWVEQPPATGQSDIGTGKSQGNPMAIAGFVFSLVMWIPIPYLNVVFWILALTFSSIGLHRSRKRGLPRRGLAIAGLCLSLVGIFFVILVILFFVGAFALSS